VLIIGMGSCNIQCRSDALQYSRRLDEGRSEIQRRHGSVQAIGAPVGSDDRGQDSNLFRHLYVGFACFARPLDGRVNDRPTLLVAHLLADDMDLQRQACDTSAMSKVIAIIKELDTDAYKGETENNKARLLEVSLCG
jgi:hypothetical protein